MINYILPLPVLPDTLENSMPCHTLTILTCGKATGPSLSGIPGVARDLRELFFGVLLSTFLLLIDFLLK